MRKAYLAGIMLWIAIILSIAPFTVRAAYYPNTGDLYYDGASYADSHLKWDNPGPWRYSDPGYEHDLVAHNLL